MLKIKVSYEKEEELREFLKCLSGRIERVKYAEQKGNFKRVYIEIKR